MSDYLTIWEKKWVYNKKKSGIVYPINQFALIHVKWFLKNHPDRISSFMEDVNDKYEKKEKKIKGLFD